MMQAGDVHVMIPITSYRLELVAIRETP